MKTGLFPVLALILALTAASFAADCSITGTWTFDMSGTPATVEYRADGTLVQDMFGMQIRGTHKVQGNKLTTIVEGTTTVFTIISCSAASVTIKRDRDGMTVVYKKK